MTGLLERRGFEVRLCAGGDATRAGILAAYERLISDVRDGDAALVYYSGHGGFARPGKAAAAQRVDDLEITGPPPDLQFIVPVDYHESSETDFRGITAVELSVLLARLTERTHNATVVLDCCHSAHMSRDPDL